MRSPSAAPAWAAGPIPGACLPLTTAQLEAISNRDGREMHDNYGPVIWGGTGERWDFLQLEKGGPPSSSAR